MPGLWISTGYPMWLHKVVLKQLRSTLAKIYCLSVFLEVKLVWRWTLAFVRVLILLSHDLAYSSEVAVTF
jgi:hypothetical protein